MRAQRLIVLHVVLLTMASVAAFAQPPSPVSCTTYPSGTSYQTIVVHLNGAGDCVINPYDGSTGIPNLHTPLAGRASWDVCNQCGQDVDVRISGSVPFSLDQLFTRFSPPMDASNSVTEQSIPVGQRSVFSADATSDSTYAGTLNKYAIAVKFSSEGEAGWDEFDPQLQIDDGGLPFMVRAVIIGLVAGLLGMGLGYALGRRRTMR